MPSEIPPISIAFIRKGLIFNPYRIIGNMIGAKNENCMEKSSNTDMGVALRNSILEDG
jgi:hypothetical protein